MSLQNFKEQVKAKGLARNNRFSISIGVPELLQNSRYSNLRLIQMYCETVNVPGLNIATQPNRSFGEQREIPYDRNFEPISMTFYVDTAMTVKTFFDAWMDCIIDPTSRTLNYYDLYIGNILVTIQDINDNKAYTLKLWEAYPKSVQAITLDNNGRDVIKLNVTFNYKYFTRENLDLLSGEPEIYNIFRTDKAEGLNNPIPSNYFNTGSTWATAVPSEYLQNALSYNEQFADKRSIANALAQIQSQGIQTGLGSIFK